jgi:hypothetical protein
MEAKNIVAHNRLSHEEFLKRIPTSVLETIEVLGTYKSNGTPILVKTKYGLTNITPMHLFAGCTPNIKGAINKTEYFKNVLKDRQYDIYNSIKVFGNYINCKTPIFVENKYGKCSVVPSFLLSGQGVNIKSALNKTEYFINQAKEVHGDKYDYSLVEYKKGKEKIKIISKYGIFEQNPNSHLQGRGCNKEGKEIMRKYQQDNPKKWNCDDWERQGLGSKIFDSFKVYIIKCWNNEEEFYKIGRTFTTVGKRFRQISRMPYNWKLIKQIEGNAEYIYNLESNLHKEHEDFKYKPELEFNGMYECFSQIKNNVIN